MSCILSNIQLEKLATRVFKDLNQAILAKTPFDLNTYIKSIYDQVLKNTQDANQAAAFAKLIPGIINKGQVIDDDVQNHVKSSIGDIIEQSISFKKDIENNALNAYLKLNKKSDIPLLNPIEKAVVLNAVFVKTESKTNSNENSFKAKPYSFLSTTFREVFSIFFKHPQYNVPIPLAKFKSDGIKTILTVLNTVGLNTNNGVNYPNVEGGLFFTAFSDSNNEIDYEKLTPDLKDFWDKKTNDNSGKEGFAQNIKGVEFIITNSDGEILYFDNEYNVVEKKDGLMLNISIRGASEQKYDENTNEIKDDGLAPIDDMAKAYGLSIPEAIDFRAKEKEKTAKLRAYLIKNPQLKLTIPITGGSKGYIEFEFYNRTIVSLIQNFEDFDFILNQRGFLSIKHISTGESFGAYKTKLSKEVIEKIAKFIGLPIIDIRTKKTITNVVKNEILQNYYDPYDVSIQDNNTIIINNKKIDLSDVNIVELIKEALSDYYLVKINDKEAEMLKPIYNFDPKTTDDIISKKIKIDNDYYKVEQINIGINKNSFKTNTYTSIESINTEGKVPVVTLSVNSKYKPFISNFVRTTLTLNAEGKSLNLNPYISWAILEGTEVYQKLYDEADEYVVVPDNTELIKEVPYVEQFNILAAPVDVGIDVASSASAADIADSILNNKKFFSKSTVVKARDIKATKKQLIDAEKWYNERKSQLSRHLPFNTAFNMINAEDPNSVAVLDSHGVTLFYGSDFSDVYHEAWHGFTQYFLTKDEKKALYKESSNLLGSFVDFNGNTVLFKNAGDLQLEEHMGEGMREYVLSGGKKVLDRTPIRNKIFQRILAFLKALFSKVSYREALNDIRAVVTIKELYDNLYIGNLNLAAFNPQNVQFDILKKGMQAVDPTLRDSYTVSYKDSLEISESVDAVFSELINLSIKQSGTSAFTYNMMVLPEGRKIGYQYVKAKFAERVAELKKELSENNQDLSAFHGFSGNAIGADKTWAAKGKDFYLGKQTDYRPESLDNLEPDAYKEAKDAYRTAARNLGRVFLDPNSENEKTAYAGRLMTRDYLQAQSADAVFAISDILFPGEFGKPTSNKKVYPNTTKKQVVDGGTGYAVEMAIMLNKPVYVFHQGTNKKHKTKVGWYKWDGAQFEKVDTPVLTEKFAGVGTRVLNDAGTKAIDDVYKATLDSLSTTKTGNNRKEQALNKSINTLIFALTNFGNIEDLSANEEGVGVIGFHKLRSEFLTFEDKFEDAENSTDNERKLFSSPGNETSVKDETSKVIQYVISSLRSNELNSLGFLKPLNSKFVYYRLTNTLKGNVGLPDIFARLKKEAVEYEPFAQLLLKLGKLDDLSNGTQSLQTAFLQSFQISESKLKQLIVNTDTVDNDGMPLSENKITLSFGESNSVFKQVQNTWETQFKKRKDKYVIPTKEGNQLNLEKIIQDFPTDTFVNSNQRSFFKAIGINLTESNIIDEKLNSIDVNPSQFLKIIKALNDNEIIVTSINDIIGDNSDINKEFKGEQGNYKVLANIEAEHSNRYSNHSQTNAENNLQYSIIRNSMMFQIVNGFNAALDFSDFVDLGGRFNGKFNHFSTIRNPYTRASSQINSIFNLDTGAKRSGKRSKANAMFLDNLSGVALTENDVNHILGQELSKLDKPSKLITAVHLLIGSYIKENPRHSDKSMSFAQYVNKLYSPFSESGNLYIATSNFADHEAGSSKFADFMMKYLIAEHDKIRMIANAKANDPILGVKLYKKEKFAYFDGILSKKVKNLLYKIEGNPLENNGLLEYLGYRYENGNLIIVENTDEQVDLRNLIIADIQIYFNKKTESLTTLYNKVGLFDPALLTKIRLEVFNEKKINLKNADIKSAILDSFVANDLIHNIEQTILFYGDIAQFRHYKKEFSKRISGAAGNGPICRDDVNFENFINSDNFGGRMLSKSKGVDYTYTSVLNTGVIKDPIIDSVSYDKILVRFKDALEKKYAKNKTTEWLSKTKKEKAKILNADALLRVDGYLKMKVADGQAYITLDIYRILSKGMDNWSNAQERLYQKIVAGEDIDVLKIAEFFPVRKFQYYGPAATNTLPITFFHKYSLFPLVPNVIKDTKLELVNDMMIAQKMDYLLYESASKLSVITNNGTPDILYNEEGNVNTDLIFTNNPIFVGYLKDQVKQSTSYKRKQRFSSQLRKIITTGLYDNGVPTDYHVNETDNVKRRIDWDKETNKEQSRNYKLQKNFEDGLNDLMKYFELDILNDIDWKIVNGVPKGDMKNLLKLIEKEFRRLDYSEQDIDFIQLTKEGKIKNDFSISLQQGQIEKLLVALAEKKLIKQNVKGETLTQVASSMFEKIGFKRAMFKKATDAQIAEFGSNDLAYYDYTINPDGSFSNTSLAEIKIGLQGDFKKLLFHTHFDNKPIKTLKRLNECIINKKWLDTGDNRKMITITSVRIPLASLNFIEGLQVKEFLPENVGNIIILPDEIVTKSGTDFDVDKQMTLFPTIKKFGKTVSLLKIVSEDYVRSLYDMVIMLKVQKDTEEKAKKRKLTDEELNALIAIYGAKKIDDKFDENEIKTILSTFDFISFDKFFNDYNIGATSNKLIQSIIDIIQIPENYTALLTPATNYIAEPISDRYKKEALKNGTVTNFQRDIDGKQTQWYNDDGELVDSISPTTALEIEFDLETHENNNIGQSVIGIGASVNAFSDILNKVGAYLNPFRGKISLEEYNILLQEREDGLFRKNDGKAYRLNSFRRQVIFLNHNYVTVDAQGNLIDTKLKPLQSNGVYKAVSLSNLNDVNNENSISEVTSQLMNGWLDIAKDEWVLYVQGNKEIAPLLLMLNEAGLSFEDNVAFTSQPLIQEYIRLIRKIKSPFVALFGIKLDNPKYYRLKAREIILSDSKYGFNLPLEVVSGPGSPTKIYEEILKYTAGYEDSFNLDTFNANKVEYKGTDIEKAIFMHFLELEDTEKSISKIRMGSSMDTSTESSLFGVYNKDVIFNELAEENVFPVSILKKIQTDSQISSFFNREFIGKLYKDLYIFRNSKALNDYCANKAKKGEFYELIDLYGDLETAVNAFKDDIISFIFQNNLTTYDVNLKTYKGLTAIDAIEAKRMGSIVNVPAAILVSNNNPVLHFNLDLIKYQYESVSKLKFPTLKSYFNYALEKAFQQHVNTFSSYVDTNDYKDRLIAIRKANKRILNKVSETKLSTESILDSVDIENFKKIKKGYGQIPETFHPFATKFKYFDKKQTPDKVTFRSNENGKYDLIDLSTGEIYISNVDLTNGFAYEIKITEAIGETTEAYKERLDKLTYNDYLTNKALDNTFNIFKLFKHPTESFVDQFFNIKNQYENEFVKDYMIFDIFEASSSKISKLKNLRLLDSKLTGDDLNNIHEELIQLANPKVIKVENEVENQIISDLFKRFTYYAFLQSGIGNKSRFGISKLALQPLFNRLMVKPLADFKMNSNILDNIFIRFKEISNDNEKSRFKNYLIGGVKKVEVDNAFKMYSPGILTYDTTKLSNITEGTDYINNALSSSDYKESDLVFIIDGATEIQGTTNQSLISNILSKPPTTQPVTLYKDLSLKDTIEQLNKTVFDMQLLKESMSIFEVGEDVEVHFKKSDSESELEIRSITKTQYGIRVVLGTGAKEYTYFVDNKGEGEKITILSSGIFEITSDLTNKLNKLQKTANQLWEAYTTKTDQQQFIQGRVPSFAINPIKETITISRESQTDTGVIRNEPIEELGYKLIIPGHATELYLIESTGKIEDLKTGRSININDFKKGLIEKGSDIKKGSTQEKLMRNIGFDVKKLYKPKKDLSNLSEFTLTQSSTSVKEKSVTNLPNGAIVIKIPVKVNPGIKSSFTDATIDDNKNKIDEALKLIAEAKAENKTFVISNLGIGQGLIGIDSMTGKPVNEGGKGEDTFVYLSRELYKLGILNKNYVQRPEFEVVETNDEDLKEFMQMCLTGGIL